MRRRERRVNRESSRVGTPRAGHGWAARQASKRHNNQRRLTARTIRRRQGR